MPNIDGYNLCKLLRKTPAFRKTPIVILTSSDNSVDRDRLFQVGATDFLSKPPADKILLETIDKHLPDRIKVRKLNETSVQKKINNNE